MTDDTPLPFDLPSVRRKKLTVEFAGGNQSSNAGLLLLRQAERELVVRRRLADAMPDRRDPDRIRHAMFEMVMERALAIACGHEDAIDLDRLRHDPLLKLAVVAVRTAVHHWRRNRPSVVWRMRRAGPRRRGSLRLCLISSARP